jgi:hypothetical protein
LQTTATFLRPAGRREFALGAALLRRVDAPGPPLERLSPAAAPPALPLESAVKALSVARPWSEAIAVLGKRIENRSWRTGYRGVVVIHASKTFDRSAKAFCREVVGDVPARHLGAGDTSPYGYLGACLLTGVCTAAVFGGSCDCGPWAMGNACHWQLEGFRAFPKPIAGPGQLSLYTPPPLVQRAVLALGIPS